MPPKLLSVVMLFVLILETMSKRYHSFAGPFRVVVKRFERCPPGEEGPHAVTVNYEIRKRHGQPNTYGGNVSVPFWIDDTLVLKGNLASWSNNGGWKPNAYQGSSKNLCKLACQHFKPHIEYGMNFYFGEILNCPFMPAFYRAYNITVPPRLLDAPQSLFSQFIYGKWRVEGKLYTQDGELLGCGIAYVETLPK